MDTTKHNLKALILELVKAFPDIESLHIFGSRAYNTGSLRSDCDILVRMMGDKHVKPSALRDFALAHCQALDLFWVQGGKATSAANESHVEASSFDELAQRLDALLLWDRINEFNDQHQEWVFETSAFSDFLPTTLPNSSIEGMSWQTLVKRAESAGLPTSPYIGDTIEMASLALVDVVRGMIFKPSELVRRSSPEQAGIADLKNEYDCQNLFQAVVKPWVPSLAREPFEIRYDGSKKTADFALFEGKLVIEMKFVKDANTKSAVVKTLDGLSRFYSQNGNVKVLLLFVFVKGQLQIDARKWEADFTFAPRLCDRSRTLSSG